MKSMYWRSLLLLLVCGCLLFPVVANSQTTQTPQPASSATAESTVPQTVPPDYRLSPEQMRRSIALYRTENVLLVIGTVYSIIILIAIIVFRFAPWLAAWAEGVSRHRFVQAILFLPPLLLLMDVLNLPISIYGHHISLAYGLSVQGWGSWFWDWTKGEVIGLVLGTLLIWLMYAVIRRSPRRWWFYFWLCTLPIILFVVFLQPVLLDPIFNKFEPLEKTNPELVTQLERVVHRGGLVIPPSRMFLMKASEKVTTYNAYVTGIGATKRVVVWDTTARDMTIPETMFVFGHEMGHYVLNHVYKGLAFFAVMMLIALWLARMVTLWALARWGERWKVTDLGAWASLPVLLLVLSIFSFFGQPIGNAFSRYIEHQADIYGLEITHGLVPNSSQNAALAFQKLGEKSFDYPYPNRWLVIWTYSHPDITSRYHFALEYKPWDEGKPNEFVK